jgi:hypothetical protein
MKKCTNEIDSYIWTDTQDSIRSKITYILHIRLQRRLYVNVLKIVENMLPHIRKRYE